MMLLGRRIATSSLQNRLGFGVKYSRDYLRSLDADKTALELQKQQIEQKIKLQRVLNMPSNDHNPLNHVKVRVNHPLFDVSYRQQTDVKECCILEPEYPKQKVFVSASRRHIITSIKKARQAMIHVRKKYVFDAISALEASHKKVAKLMIRTFWNLLDHAKMQKLDVKRLWVHGCLIGKKKRMFGLRYHAKGRGFREKTDFIQIKVILYEKNEDQFYDEIAQGKAAPGFASIVRATLLHKDVEYGSLAKFSYITTAKGRQQAHQIVKRHMHRRMVENDASGTFVPKKTVHKQVVRQIAEKIKPQIQDLLRVDSEELLLQRQLLYKKNMENK